MAVGHGRPSQMSPILLFLLEIVALEIFPVLFFYVCSTDLKHQPTHGDLVYAAQDKQSCSKNLDLDDAIPVLILTILVLTRWICWCALRNGS
jgi:hypothetical protein